MPARALPPDWETRLAGGDRRCLARVISLLEDHRLPSPEDAALRAALGRLAAAAGPPPRVIGFTGPPGAGKSTLVGACVQALASTCPRIAVVAVDPSSPVSGGAVLGDRVRMGPGQHGPGVFFRSLASRGHLGGLSRAARPVLTALAAARYPLVLLETVGTGQSEIEVADLATTRVLVCAPNLGDEIQALKAGVLEVADIVVVNKGDQPGAERTRDELERTLAGRARPDAWPVPVVVTAASTGAGVESLIAHLGAHARHAGGDGGRRAPARSRPERERRLADAARGALEDRLSALPESELEALEDALREGGGSAVIEHLARARGTRERRPG